MPPRSDSRGPAWRLALGAAAAWCAAAPAPARGQLPAAQLPAAPARTLRATVDNDLLALRGTGVPADYDYTHGTRVAAAWAGAPRWAARLAGRARACRDPGARRAGCLAAGAELAQEIYTPRRDAPRPVPDERPYAAVLSAAGSLTAVAPGRTHALTLAVGTTGPPALGRPVQNGVHRLLGSARQLGWAHQLAPRPVLTLRYDAARWAERAVGARGVGALRVRYGAAAGTARSAVSAGADLVVGRRGAAPWTPADPEVERPARVYLRAGVRQELVLRDAFVGGWRRGDAAAGRPWVPQGEAGAGYRWARGAVEYRHVVRGREYRAQPAPHAYGAVAVTLNR